MNTANSNAQPLEKTTRRFPLLFIGHGNPMHALNESNFSRTLKNLGERLRQNLGPPQAILCVSAHWLSRGTYLTEQAHPRTVHDFGGFPKALYEIQYPAPGAPELAQSIQSHLKTFKLKLDQTWGLDHGAWSVLRHLFPAANVPVLQLSLDLEKEAAFHFELGQALQFLRQQGVLIIGSGNIVHNLQKMNWQPDAAAWPWAHSFDLWVKTCLESRDFKALLTQTFQRTDAKMSIPSPDHWYPLLYILGASQSDDQLFFEYEGLEHASISQRSFRFEPV